MMHSLRSFLTDLQASITSHSQSDGLLLPLWQSLCIHLLYLFMGLALVCFRIGCVIWSGKRELVQRAETHAETECQVPSSVCLPSPVPQWVASLL